MREAVIQPGDRVLVRNVGLKGKQKLPDRWEKDVYIIIEQSIPEIPVFRVRKEHTRKVKTLQRNQLLPFMSLPVKTRSGAKSSCINNTDTVLDVSANDVATISVGTDEQFSANPTQNSKSVGYNTESVAPTSNSKSDKHNSKSNTDRYIIPARRGMLDPKAVPFVPRPSRVKRSPKWMQSPDWCFQ